jgi:pilus assembly protein CpaF
MSIQSAEEEAPSAALQQRADKARGSDRQALLAKVQPLLLEDFKSEDVARLPRPELALRIGQIVTNELSDELDSLNLLERRNLVGDLITWLLSQSKPSQASSDLVKAEASRKAVQSRKKDDAADEPAPHTATVESAKSRIQPLVMERLDLTAASQLPRRELAYQVGEIVTELLQEEQIRLNGPEHQAVVDLMLDDMLGLGPLEPLLADESITDIMVNGPQQVYVEQSGKLNLTSVKFRDDAHVLNVARRIVSQVGRRVDETTPLVDARLKDGSRVNIIIPPLAIDGPSISIRKFAKKKITLDVMMRQGNISEAMCTLLKIASRSRLNILISGGTGSGKTTLLNAMSQMIDHGERVVTIEDAAELQLQQPHVVRLETRPANLEGQGDITMRDLVKNALRMRPDRIILGEVRGSEAVDMLQAMNTGHDGSLGTIHANRPREALTRLENMIGLAGINLPAKAVRTQVAAALDMIVQIARMRDGMRRITHVTEVIGMEGDIVTTQDLFTFQFEGESDDGLIQGTYKPSGLRPFFAPKAAYFGLERKLMEVMG